MLKGQSDEEKVFAHVAQELERQQKYKMIITTDSKWKFRWNIFIGVLVLYNGVLIPWNISFGRPFDWTLYIDYSVDVFFLIDIFLSLRTSYITKTGVEVMNSVMIRKRYMRTWFTIDVISIIPFELLALLLDRVNGRIFFSLLKVPRLLRLGRLMKQFDKFSNANFLRLVKLLGAFVLFAHWVACAWYFIGRYQRDGNYWTGPVWLVEEGLCQTRSLNGDLYYRSNVLSCIPRGSSDYLFHGNYFTSDEVQEKVSGHDASELNIRNHINHDVVVSYADRRTSYITALYWAFTTLTTVGFGDIVPSTNIERLFAMFVMLMGSVIYATIFGNVSLLVQNFDKQHARLRRALNQMSSLADFYNLSEPIRAKLRSYAMKYTYQVCGVDARRVLVELPQNSRNEILHEMHAPLLCRMKVTIPALLNCSSFLTELLHSSKACLVSMGDSVRVHCFVESAEIFILSEGLMHVIAVQEEQKDIFSRETPSSTKALVPNPESGIGSNMVTKLRGRRNADLLSPKTSSFHSYDMKINQTKDTPNGTKLMILGAGDIFWGACERQNKALTPCVAMLQAEVNCELLQIQDSASFFRNFPYEMKLLKKYITERWMSVLEHDKTSADGNSSIPYQIERLTQQQQQQLRGKRRASHFHVPWRERRPSGNTIGLGGGGGGASKFLHHHHHTVANGGPPPGQIRDRNSEHTIDYLESMANHANMALTLEKKRSLSVPCSGGQNRHKTGLLSSEHEAMAKAHEKMHKLLSRRSTDSLPSFGSMESSEGIPLRGIVTDMDPSASNGEQHATSTVRPSPSLNGMIGGRPSDGYVQAMLDDKDSDDSSLHDLNPDAMTLPNQMPVPSVVGNEEIVHSSSTIAQSPRISDCPPFGGAEDGNT